MTVPPGGGSGDPAAACQQLRGYQETGFWLFTAVPRKGARASGYELKRGGTQPDRETDK